MPVCLLVVVCAFIATPSLAATSYTRSTPPSVSYAVSEASYFAPSITTIGEILSTAELSSPSLSYAEYVIESYEALSSSIVSFLQSAYEYPSTVAASSIESVESEYPTLFSAVETVESAEATNPSLSAVQSTLEYVESQASSTILTALGSLSADEYPSVYYASQAIEDASITDSSIFSDELALYNSISESSVSTAVSYLSQDMYTLPSTVGSYVISYISSPSTIAPSQESYLSYYYPTLYSYLKSVESFTSAYPSVVRTLTSCLSAASSVSSLSTAVSLLVYYQMPTFEYQKSVLSQAEQTWLSASTDLAYLSYLAATSPSFADALSYIEDSFYESPEIASSLYSAFEYPSRVTDTERIASESVSHQSLVSAFEDVSSFQSDHPSYSSAVSSILYYATSAFETEGELLTAYSFISGQTSASAAIAYYSVSQLEDVETDAMTVLSGVSYAMDYDESLASAEYVIESEAYSYPSAAETIWNLFEYPSAYSSEVTYAASLEASYPQLASAMESVYSAESSYPSVASYESSFVELAQYDSELTTEASVLTQAVSNTSDYYSYY